MRKKGGVVAVGIIGSIIIVFTITAFFLLNIERSAVNWWALAFLLLSEVVLFGGLVGLRYASESYCNLFFRVGLSSTLSLYFIATFISVLFTGAFRENLNMFILLELAIIAFFGIVAVSIFAWSRRISHKNVADLTKVGTNAPKRGGF